MHNAAWKTIFFESNAAPNTARGGFRCHPGLRCGAAMSPALPSIEPLCCGGREFPQFSRFAKPELQTARLNQIIKIANTIHAAYVKNAKKEPLRKALPGLIPKLLLLASSYQEVAEHPAVKSASPLIQGVNSLSIGAFGGPRTFRIASETHFSL